MASNQLKKTLKGLKVNESFFSRILGALVLIVVGVLIFNYFQGYQENNNQPEKQEPENIAYEDEDLTLVEEEGVVVPEGLPQEYTIAVGDDLWNIAETNYGSGYNWVDIAQANQITNPDQIETGQKITLPKAEVKQLTKNLVAGTNDDLQPETTNAISGSEYLVQKGDYLWDIALRAYGDGYQWVKIAQANDLENPNIIHPGNTLQIPR